MTEDNGSTDEAVPGVNAEASSERREPSETRDRSLSPSDWEGLLEALRTRVQEQIAVWPEKVEETIDLVEMRTSDTVPVEDEILIYVHGYLGQGRLEGINISGANQAAALGQALVEECRQSPASPPTVVAATWNSSTIWPRATKRAVAAGTHLSQWLTNNANVYDRVILVGHSLGGRVVLNSLGHLDDGIVDSVGLLGAAVQPEAVCGQYRPGIEAAVDGGVFNYHSRNDAIVCRLYSFREGSDGIGCNGTVAEDGTGIGDLPGNYRDVDVSETVRRHMDYFKPLPETAAGNCVRELVERQIHRT